MNEHDAAYEILRCAVYFSDPNCTHEHDKYYEDMFLSASRMIQYPVFELHINVTSKGRDHQLSIKFQSGSYTMKNLTYPQRTYDWLEEHLYNHFYHEQV